MVYLNDNNAKFVLYGVIQHTIMVMQNLCPLWYDMAYLNDSDTLCTMVLFAYFRLSG